MLHRPIIRRIHSWALDTEPRYRYGLTLLVSLFLGYGLLSGYLNLTGSLLARYNKRIDAMQKEQLANISISNDCARLHTELIQLHETVDSYYRRMDLSQDHLLQILSAARTCQLTLNSCGPIRETPMGWRTKKVIQTSARGTLPQIIQFFTVLQSSDMPMKCHTMSVTQNANGMFSLGCSLSTLSLDIKNPST